MDWRQERVVVETERYRVEGKLRTAPVLMLARRHIRLIVPVTEDG